MDVARWDTKNKESLLCVLLLKESDIWWCLKVSLVSFVFRLVALLEYSTCDLTHVCLQYMLFFP